MSGQLLRVVAWLNSVGDELPVPEGERANAEQLRNDAKRIVEDFHLTDRRGILDRITDWIGRQFSKLSDTAKGGDGPLNQIGLLLLILAIGVLIYFIIRGASGMTKESATGRSFDDEEGRAPTDWRDDAEAFERKGDYRSAVRCWYRSLIAELAGRSVVREFAGKTAGEYRREIRAVGAPELYEPCRRVCDVFELVWYGDFAVTASDAQLARTLVNEALNVSSRRVVGVGAGAEQGSPLDYMDYPPA